MKCAWWVRSRRSNSCGLAGIAGARNEFGFTCPVWCAWALRTQWVPRVGDSGSFRAGNPASVHFKMHDRRGGARVQQGQLHEHGLQLEFFGR